ncbi:MAG TPA: GGDEF domain-containing protein [Polyangia bacterium]|jgi:diguanylate cyclase (GGDEF)-like protein|nr:GGDEF domain-containing protein [Polyangia bacterium]
MSRKPPEDLVAELVRLSRQNATLRREVARLAVFRAMAYRDPLTGLWNRRFFEERLREELSRSQRAGVGRRFSVMIVDIDDFKQVNDRDGHAAGDAVLKEVGEFLIAHLRTHDVACRTGGDEFGILLPDLSAEDSGHLVERLRAARAAANAGRQMPILLSLGTASWPEAGDSIDALLGHADQAMYADKRRRKAREVQAGATRKVAARGPSRRTFPRRSRAPVSVA